METTKDGDLLERFEGPMMVVAGLAVALYVGDLAGFWLDLGWSRPVWYLALLFDLMFCADLFLKTVFRGWAYWRTPWAVLDVMCTLPVLSSLSLGPGLLQGLRMMRVLRVLRSLRMLRALRMVQVLRGIGDSKETEPTAASGGRLLTVTIVLYGALFVMIVLWARGAAPVGQVVAMAESSVPGQVDVTVQLEDGSRLTESRPYAAVVRTADRSELGVVVGALVGLALLIIVTRFQVPAIVEGQVRTLLNVALPEQVARWLMENPANYHQTVRMPATVLFCDIQGFTRTSEHLELSVLKKHLERALHSVVHAHREQGLIIDKFIGDAVMSFHGGNVVGGEPADSALRVVLGGIRGIRHLRELDDPWFQNAKVGGASAQQAMIGAFGTRYRLSYTILGDRVNLAARLEASCNALGVDNLWDDATRELTRGSSELQWRRVGPVRVQGRGEVTQTWQAYETDQVPSWLAEWNDAMTPLMTGDLDRFSAALDALSPQLVNDGLWQVWRRALDQNPSDWDGVLSTTK